MKRANSNTLSSCLLLGILTVLLALSGCTGMETVAPTAPGGSGSDSSDSAENESGVGDTTPVNAAPQVPAPALENVAYAANSETQKLDIYLPEGAGPFPVVLLIHGGAFALGDKSMSPANKMFALTKEGFAVVSIDYRLSGEALFPAALADVKGAIRFLRANAEQYSLDPDKFAVWGESAGAYLAVMAAVTGDDVLTSDVQNDPNVSSRVMALGCYYGPMEFWQMDADFAELGVGEDQRKSPIGGGLTNTAGSPESKFVGKNVGDLSEEGKATLDPLTYIAQLSADSELHVLIKAGDADTNVPYLQTERVADAFADKLGEGRVTRQILPGAAHMDAAFYAEDQIAAFARFLKEAFGA